MALVSSTTCIRHVQSPGRGEKVENQNPRRGVLRDARNELSCSLCLSGKIGCKEDSFQCGSYSSSTDPHEFLAAREPGRIT